MTWATEADVRLRYGDEFIDKLATRRVWSEMLGTYVADESQAHRSDVINAALQDAKDLILFKLSCKFKVTDDLRDGISFYPSVKQWHYRLTIDTLKEGGDCWACKCMPEFEEFLGCGTICSEDGKCLESLSTFVLVSEAKFDCEKCFGGCKCCR